MTISKHGIEIRDFDTKVWEPADVALSIEMEEMIVSDIICIICGVSTTC